MHIQTYVCTFLSGLLNCLHIKNMHAESVIISIYLYVKPPNDVILSAKTKVYDVKLSKVKIV